MDAYRRVLGAPGVVSFALASVLARIPTGMAPIALVLYLHGETGSFATAGVAVAAYTVGVGLTAPFLGRLLDSHGRAVLFPAGLVSALALAAVVALESAGASRVAVVAAAALTGLAMPPVSGVVRHRMPEMIPAADAPTAYALDSILIEVLFVSGPLLAGILAATAGPAAGVLAAAALGLAGSAWFALLLPPHPPREKRETVARGRFGALASPRIRFLALLGAPVGAAFGALDVALPAFGVAHGSAALGGPFGATLALGSGVGGIVYGAHPRALGPPRTAFVRLGWLHAALLLPLLIGPSVPLMFVLTSISCCALAPLISARSELVREALPTGTSTEAFTWTTVTITFGASAGSALAGPLVESAGWRAGVALACAFPLAAAIATVVWRRLL